MSKSNDAFFRLLHDALKGLDDEQHHDTIMRAIDRLVDNDLHIKLSKVLQEHNSKASVDLATLANIIAACAGQTARGSEQELCRVMKYFERYIHHMTHQNYHDARKMSPNEKVH